MATNKQLEARIERLERVLLALATDDMPRDLGPCECSADEYTVEDPTIVKGTE